MEILKKRCSKCQEEKPLDDFYEQSEGYLGRRSSCKACFKETVRKSQEKNPDYKKNYRKKYSDAARKSSLRYYYRNKEKCQEKARSYYHNNKDKQNQHTREYYRKNKDALNEYGREYYKNNKEKYRQYARNRYKKNSELAAIKWMRNYLYRCEQQGFSKSKMNTIMEFGYTPKELIQRIECQFKDGMSWKNRSEWHIDHKKPISKFNEGTSPRTINMLCNLQPIWKTENLSKRNKF